MINRQIIGSLKTAVNCFWTHTSTLASFFFYDWLLSSTWASDSNRHEEASGGWNTQWVSQQRHFKPLGCATAICRQAFVGVAIEKRANKEMAFLLFRLLVVLGPDWYETPAAATFYVLKSFLWMSLSLSTDIVLPVKTEPFFHGLTSAHTSAKSPPLYVSASVSAVSHFVPGRKVVSVD